MKKIEKKRIVTFFPTFRQRLTALAELHQVKPKELEALLADMHCAYPNLEEAEREITKATRELAKLNVTARQIDWVLQVH